jgi:hypothetical protein
MKAPRSQVHAFLASIRTVPHVGHAAIVAGISRSAHYKRYERDPMYRKAFDEAWRWGVGRLRDEAIKRALYGYQEPVVYKGKMQYTGKGKTRRLVTVTKYPERLMMRVLGAEIPDVYQPRMQVEHTGTLAVVVEKLQEARKRMLEAVA